MTASIPTLDPAFVTAFRGGILTPRISKPFYRPTAPPSPSS